MRVAITGAGGFVGSVLLGRLRSRGHEVIGLSRAPEAEGSASVEWRRFDPNAGTPQPEAFAGADAVVHLAGESVAGRWDAEKKRRIRDSRVLGTRLLVESLRAMERKPRTLISASATGFYGDRGDEPLDERAKPGSDFLAGACVEWEREASAAADAQLRVAFLRTGIVLGNGGALAAMLMPFRAGAGGPFGSGRQFVPWIHVDDLADLYIFALENESLRGAVNAVAPDYATSARFSQAVGAAIRRPAIVPAPGFALRIVLGEFAETLLGGQLVLPAVASDAGFLWKHETLEHAVANALNEDRPFDYVRRVERSQLIPVSSERAFEFFADAKDLQAITPPQLHFTIRQAPAALQRGSILTYRLRLHGVPVNWKTMIARWNPPHAFDDVQLHGPYAFWHHRHRLEAAEGGTRVHDRVDYALPLQPFSAVAQGLVERDVNRIFDYRSLVLPQRLSANLETRSAPARHT